MRYGALCGSTLAALRRAVGVRIAPACASMLTRPCMHVLQPPRCARESLPLLRVHHCRRHCRRHHHNNDAHHSGVWHRFSSLRPPDPAFFAISVHTDETGGKLDAATAAAVAANESSIGLLTQRLPAAVEEAIAVPGALDRVPISLLVLE